MNARFTSDHSVRESGFALDVQSIPCSDRANYPQYEIFNPQDVYSSTTSYPEYTEGIENGSGNNGGCDDSAQQVVIAPGEVFYGALISDTVFDGNYPNHACQNWKIIADQDQVHVLFQRK